MKVYYMLVLLVLIIVQACGPKLIVDAKIDDLENAMKDDQNNAVAHFNIGLKYYSEHEFDKSIRYFYNAIERDYHFALAYFGIYCAEILNNQTLRKELLKENPKEEYKNKIDTLNIFLNNALMYDPFFDWKMGTLLLPQKESATDIYTQRMLDQFYKILHDGFREFLLGNYKNAEKELTYSLMVLPKYHQARYIRGLARAHINNFKGAIQDFKSLIVNNKDLNKDKILPIYQESAELYFLIGSLYLKLNNIKEAKWNYEKALEEDLSFYMAHVQLSNIHQQLKNCKEAHNEIESAIFLRPDDPILHFNKGVFLAKLGKMNEAIQAYKESLNKNIFSYKASYNLSFIYEKLGQIDESKYYYIKFIETAPKADQKLVEQIKNKIESWD